MKKTIPRQLFLKKFGSLTVYGYIVLCIYKEIAYDT